MNYSDLVFEKYVKLIRKKLKSYLLSVGKN